LREAFSLELPPRWHKGTPRYDRSIPAPFLFATLFLVFATAVAVVVPSRQETIPPRRDFSHFPLTVGEWHGKSQRLDDLYVNVLKFDDYLAVDFLDPMRNRVNFYVAYYGSQRKGESVHSPASCIPGGGWEIAQLSERALGGVMMGGKPLRVNRVLIQKGDEKQLVYYWFQQRERVIISEYLVKWYLFWDALTRNRTDGALIRMVTPVAYGQTPEEADARLTHFAKTAVVELERYLPD
jgi:EpsI family protein